MNVPLDIASATELWAALDAATRDRTPFTFGFLGTLGLSGEPRVRGVILRQVDAHAGVLRFATDIRTAKADEIDADPRIAFTVYDAERGVQLRLEGRAEVVRDDTQRRAAWASFSEQTRALYSSSSTPGTPAAHGERAARLGDDAAFERFAWVSVLAARMDAIDLSAPTHRRWLHTASGGRWESRSVVP